MPANSIISVKNYRHQSFICEFPSVARLQISGAITRLFFGFKNLVPRQLPRHKRLGRNKTRPVMHQNRALQFIGRVDIKHSRFYTPQDITAVHCTRVSTALISVAPNIHFTHHFLANTPEKASFRHWPLIKIKI